MFSHFAVEELDESAQNTHNEQPNNLSNITALNWSTDARRRFQYN